MDKGYVQIFCGNGDGKSSAAIGKGIFSAIEGKRVIIIQFMKRRNEDEAAFFEQLEPQIKMFRFEKSDTSFDEMSDKEREEERNNITNGINYAKKVLTTGECDVLILDEALGLINEGIVSMEQIIQVICAKDEYETVFLTGINLPEALKDYVDIVSTIETQNM
ncbi:cob(I)yrinic acid a,c-diamide adenosyltransferase [Lachnospiraceae bacterium HCP1S3_C3]|nr:cob(I)yrinic acid a,c-diamide adenosyltransferase [Lachnospiraceae bacterium]MDD6857161.1 cob(I)yrinic acid a,c-diamide adenosyltransferase [Lachnospiraceae bacterium]